MKKLLRLFIQVIVFVVLILVVLIFRPVPQGTVNNSAVVSGTVVKIFEGSSSDIHIDLEENHNHYYINRGVESGLNANEMQSQMQGRSVTIWYDTHWTPLDPHNRHHHVYRLDFNGETVYNEME